MDNKSFGEIAERLLEVNKTIAKLDPAIRASAFEILKDYAAGVKAQGGHDHKTSHERSGATVNLEALVNSHPDLAPNENVKLLTAHWYSRYGLAPFTLENIRKSAEDTGLTIPQRVDMTLRKAKEGGKKLYQSAGYGLFKPTVQGELYLKKTFSISKGSGTPPTAAKS